MSLDPREAKRGHAVIISKEELLLDCCNERSRGYAQNHGMTPLGFNLSVGNEV